MSRSRVPGYITQSKSSDFGLEVEVRRSARPAQDSNAADGVTKDGVIQPPFTGYREVIPPGTIGSVEGHDPMEPPPQHVYTVERYETEEKDPNLHSSVKSLAAGEVANCGFQAYGSFQPRTAPLPRNASDEVFLRGYGENAADPRMSDFDSSNILTPRDKPDRCDLYGENRDGVLHNEGHPGFAAVQSQIAKKSGVSQERAGAILAASTRRASPAAKKANPRLKRVKG